ncbi:acetyl-CoA carboxylase biotin carboxyl carrier protein [Sneathiella sp.]|uniref:acetyl-CoA carboxylase biotin carboxyl carrier protein n=1 Tax=Sneathiella sp. TaxID=1964365 RepID=UPI00260EE791|nr:acetyl-CoA carboxylase biotin carboxyl carrier protein [Sneathiella sp.]MDF2369011.1 acetyl-CoA carboxylase biotin carboxyl carrier protein [Sneathiella sp.]
MNKLNIDKKAIRELAEIMNETGLGEIEIETGDHRLRVSRGSSSAGVETVQAIVPAAAPAAPAPVAPAADAAAHPGAVKSPMVGTVYLSPEPTAAPFVRPGDMVTEGQTLLIVEAMKTMNPIGAPKAGKVVEILVANEEPCEYGQPLVILE